MIDILKFRILYERKESYRGAKVTALDDLRITPQGKWLPTQIEQTIPPANASPSC
jgi:lipopolysaccharide/colanic/teichoic acid biosynthesis glycosyltransferase